MKRLFITSTLATLLGVFLSVFATYAQSYYSKIHIGFKVGINVANFTKDIGPFDKNSEGFSTGLFSNSEKDFFLTGSLGITADYRITDMFSIATEVLLNGHGGGYRMKRDDIVFVDTAGNETPGYDKFVYDLYNVEMPVILRYELPVDDPKTSYSIYSGVSPGINIYSNVIYNYYTISDDGDVGTQSRIQPLPGLRKYQLNTIFGFYMAQKKSSLDIPLTMFFDIRYEQTYYPVFNNNTYHGQNYQTGIWNLNFSLGIKF